MSGDLTGQGGKSPATYKNPSDQGAKPNSVGTTMPPTNVAGKEVMNFEEPHGFGGDNPGPH